MIAGHTDIWAEFPNIDRRLRLRFAYDLFSGDTAPKGDGLGCHARWISQMYLRADTFGVIQIQSLSGAPLATSTYGGLANSEYQLVQTALTKWIIPEATKIELFKFIIDQFDGPAHQNNRNQPSGFGIVVLSDIVNPNTPEMPKHSGIPKVWAARGFKVIDLIKYLIDNKIGVVVGSPIVRNQWHQSSKNFSLPQAFFWIPSHMVKYTMPDSMFIANAEAIPDMETWYSNTEKRLSGTGKDYIEKNLLRPEFLFARKSA